jgi:signal transduction histidine kinase
MTSTNLKPQIPLATGAAFTILMLHVVTAGERTTDLADQAFIEAPYFLAATFLACLAAPRRPIASGLFVLVGIYIGVIIDVTFRSMIDERAASNLFPFAAVFIMVFACPSIFAISLAFVATNLARKGIEGLQRHLRARANRVE